MNLIAITQEHTDAERRGMSFAAARAPAIGPRILLTVSPAMGQGHAVAAQGFMLADAEDRAPRWYADWHEGWIERHGFPLEVAAMFVWPQGGQGMTGRAKPAPKAGREEARSGSGGGGRGASPPVLRIGSFYTAGIFKKSRLQPPAPLKIPRFMVPPFSAIPCALNGWEAKR